MLDRWREPRRLAGWEPDLARDVLLALVEEGGDDLALAQTGELLGKVFAVTGEWELARDAYTTAAEAWSELDRVRAEVLRAVASSLPLTPFPGDRDALMTEIAFVRRAFEGEPPLAERAIAELRRSLAPRPITGRIEAAFGLSPEELALVIAAATPIVDPDAAPILPIDDWLQVLAASTGVVADPTRLLALGVVRATPDLVPHPGVASRLIGRTSIDHPAGVRLIPVEPIGRSANDTEDLARVLFAGFGIGVLVGPSASGRRTTAARIVGRRGRKLFTARPAQGASANSIVEAALEARLNDGLLAVDLDDWRSRGVDTDLLTQLAPIVVVSRDEPGIPAESRAFTMYPSKDGVSSTR